MKRRLLAGLLSCVMLFGLLPATALADEVNEGSTEENVEPAGTTADGPGVNTALQIPTVAKTATKLDADTKETHVTLEVNGSEGKDNIAVMFLLDKSTSQGTARQNAAQMLQTLKSKINTNILYDVIVFSGSATSTGWRDIRDDAQLDDTMKNFVNRETTSGTNMLSAIYKAQEDLEELPEDYQGCTYLVTISDGITYVWDNSAISDEGVVSKEGDGTVMSMVADQIADGGKNHHVNNAMTTWDILHGLSRSVSDIYDSYAGFLEAVPQKIANTEEYLIPYGTSLEGVAALPVYTDKMNEAEEEYACGAEFAMYYSTYAYANLIRSFDRVYTLPMPEVDANGNEKGDWENYPCGKEMMLYMQDNFSTNASQGAVHDADSEEIFSEIGDQILYSIKSGTVTDVIGSNFDLADVNSFALTIGGELNKENGELIGGTQVAAKNVDGNTVTFGESGEYVVTYHPAAENETEHFVWEINTPVAAAGSLHLTYTLKLTAIFKDGIHGEYDADGSENNTGLWTNECAKLEYTSNTDNSAGELVFPKPTVSYTVEGSGTPGTGGGGGSGSGSSSVLNTDDHYSYIIGYKDGSVRPYGTITRGEVATIFFRLLTDDARDEYWSQTNGYSDCDPELWCNNAISTLSNMGIINGFNDGTFRPNGKITRAQFAKIAVGFFETAQEEYQGCFSDVPEGAWYTEYIEAASRTGLIQGFQDGTFRPDTNITRAQACVIVNRTLNRKPDKDHLLPQQKMVNWPDNDPDDWYYADMQEATNSHDYAWLTKGDDKKYMEDWTKKLEQRDWAAFEHTWSTVHSAPGGEVVK